MILVNGMTGVFRTFAHCQGRDESLHGRGRLFGGPSYFTVEQEVVTGVEADEVYPFDTAEFRRATTARAKGSAVGFNAGLDFARMFGRRVGAGALVRYARASVDLDAPAARRVSTDGGGMQATIGMRVLF